MRNVLVHYRVCPVFVVVCGVVCLLFPLDTVVRMLQRVGGGGLVVSPLFSESFF